MISCDRLEKLRRVGVSLRSGKTRRGLCETVVAAGVDLLPATAAVVRTDDGTEPVATRGVADAPEPIAGGPGLVADTATNGEAAVIDEVATVSGGGGSPYRSALSVPTSGGVFQALSTTAGAFGRRDRLMAELLVERLDAALERIAESDRAAELFEGLPDAAIRYRLEDGTPIIEATNAAFAESFGYDRNRVVGASVVDLLVPESDREDPPEVAEDERPRETELDRLTADGPRAFLLRRVPACGYDSRTGYLIYADIGALKQRERALQSHNERLERFASVLSHDIRNPLGVAKGYCELAREREDVANLQQVEASLDRIDEIVDDVLRMTRDGKPVVEADLHPLTALVDDAWAVVDTREADLIVEADRPIEGDAARLKRALENLFRNAVEHAASAPEAAALTVRVGTTDSGFYVADDGEGISDEDRIFERGYTTAAEGTGLGLASVSEIVTAHGWEIEAHESDSGGARFEFRL